MCGLFGVVIIGYGNRFSNADLDHARMARDTLTHRGPDQRGEIFSGNVYMGHRRLSILDLSETGWQPMVSDDAAVAITVNGEIYNFQILRSELERSGYVFRSQSDSEVVLHGYRHWGAEGLAERLDGMFAAVVHDRARGTVSIIRDRAGIKPLYYYNDGTYFIWASELKAIEACVGSANLKDDETALYDFLTYRYIPAPKTRYRNVFKLPQASILTLKTESGEIRVSPYWVLPVSSRPGQESDFIEELQSILRQSVAEQMISDVPVGFLLSGGIDSSLVTMTGAALSPAPMTFSIGFEDRERDESRFAQIVAEKAGTDHHSHVLQTEEMENLPERMKEWFDEPFGDTSAVPTFRVCSFARQYVTVALSGDGGDELFGGYRWYQSYKQIRSAQKAIPFVPKQGIEFPAWVPQRRRMTLLSLGDPIELYAHLRGGLQGQRLNQWRERLGVPVDYDRLWAYRAHYRPDLPPRKAAQVMDFHTYLPDDILTKVDRVSMAVALECRPPFLSRAMIEFAYSLPESFLYKGGQLKGGLKAACAGILPESIINRGKQGFSVPDSGWRTAITQQSGSLQEAFLEHIQNKAA